MSAITYDPPPVKYSVAERGSGKISGRSELWPAADVSLPGSSADVLPSMNRSSLSKRQ
jgi:hypothetical protein